MTIVRVYEQRSREETVKVLRDYGHTATKALEIAIDAERGNAHARAWVEKVFRLAARHPAT